MTTITLPKPVFRPLGVGDLKVTKQRLARYEAGEVAHIENVMEGETRDRDHRRMRQFEQTFTEETEQETESQKDLQSTERFELENEVKNTVKEESSFKAGVTASGGFGPVKVSAYAKHGSSSSKESSDRTASKYAKEVTEKSVSRFKERIRQQRTTRNFEEIEETNHHGFEASSGHNVGIYRWVDKYYRARTVNYGKRLLYEFVVPEPAAFYLYTLKPEFNTDLPIEPEYPKVPLFYIERAGRPREVGAWTELSPDLIIEENYMLLVKKYGAEGIKPYPEPFRIAKAFSFSSDNNWNFGPEEIKIPKGYAAGEVRSQYFGSNNPGGRAIVNLGDLPLNQILVSEGMYFNPLTGQRYHFYHRIVGDVTGSLVVSGSGVIGVQSSINIEVLCSPTNETITKWKLETYNAIMNAYRKQLMDYEEKLAAAQVQEGVQIGGKNPLENRKIEREEIKKAFIQTWSGNAFLSRRSPFSSSWDFIDDGSSGSDSPEFDPMPSHVVRFFEEAFDWDNMTYEFYPYYWGRRNKWIDLQGYTDPDPIFEKFLKAGAARVHIPVQLKYSDAVLFYQLTGMIWNPEMGDVSAIAPSSDPEVMEYNAYLHELGDLDAEDDINRDIDFLPLDTGTSSGGNDATTLKDTTKSWTDNAFNEANVIITDGEGKGQVRRIVRNTNHELTVDRPWAVIPDDTSEYKIDETFMIKVPTSLVWLQDKDLEPKGDVIVDKEAPPPAPTPPA